MHECPECGQACDCDQEDVWMDDLQTMLHCSYECEQFDDDDDSGYQDFLDDSEEIEPSAKRDAVELSVEQTGAGVPLPKVDTSYVGLDLSTSKPDETVTLCGNCGVPRFVHSGIIEKCPLCGDDEIDLSLIDTSPI